MVLEAVVLIVDNSEWMRNGDFSPSRYDAQFDTCNIICGQRSEDNVQSSLGLITCVGDRPEVKVTLTDDIGEIITSLHKVRIGGTSHFVQSLKVGQLVLNHKRNPLQGLRIIVFVGSPITDSENDLVFIAELLRKNKISVDIVSFGETEANDGKLELFFKTLTQGSGTTTSSNLIKVPTGIGGSLSDHLRSTPILGLGSVGGESDMGVNPNVDPELYHALELSRQQVENIPQLDSDGDVNMYDDEVQQAIQLSLQTGNQPNEGEQKNNPPTDPAKLEQPPSNQPPSDQPPVNPPNQTESTNDMNVDVSNISSDFLEEVLGGLEGVDLQNPDIQQLLSTLKKDEKKPQENPEKKDS